MQQKSTREEIRMMVERILKEAFPQETGGARLQQIGVFTIIYMLQGEEEAVTQRRIATMTGQSEGAVGYQLKKLFKVELIERKKILNKQGRGYAWSLLIKDNEKTRALVKAIDKSAAKKKR
jgi:predicted transcriptional regulator